MTQAMGRPTWTEFASFADRRHERLFGDRVNRCFASRPTSFYSLLACGVAANRDGEAIVDGESRWSYAEMEEEVGKVAAGLQERGVKRGDRVALLMGNSFAHVAMVFAIAKIGAILVPLNIREEARELAFILNDCGAMLIVHDSDLSDRVPAAGDIPSVGQIVALDQSAGDVLAPLKHASPLVEPVDVAEEDVAAIIYTSGTTGRPKGAMIGNVNIVHSAMHYQQAMDIGPNDRSVIAVPMSHITGLIALVTLCTYAGASLVIMKQFNAAEFLTLAERERISHSLLVPAMFALCLMRPEAAQADLGSWRVAGYGGAIMPEATLHRIGQVFPNLQLINVYGATETTSPAVMMPPKFSVERAHQVGLPVPCADIRVMDADGKEVSADRTGEIWISGPMVIKGYWNNPEATAKEFVGPYWKSGDVGAVDSAGFIRIVDRIKDVINRGGYKIYASEVENILLQHDGVTDVAVVAKPCPVLGERVHAFLVVEGEVSANDLARYVEGHLADYKRPEEFHLVAELPRNANGKVLKKDLREKLRS